MLAIGLFAERDRLEGFSEYAGLIHGGGFYLLGVQLLACLSLIIWAAVVTYILIWVSNQSVNSRDVSGSGPRPISQTSVLLTHITWQV